MNTNRYYDNAYRRHLRDKIRKLQGEVFVRDQLQVSRSNKEQLKLNRALNAFIEEGLIIKISHGLYAKAVKMNFPNGESKVVLQKSFEQVAMEALDRLGVKWELGQDIQAYNKGETTQIPAVFTVKLNSRFRGTIQAEGRKVLFEGGRNAR